MNFEDAEIDQSSTPNAKSKVLGVIVLTDNRQTPQDAKEKSQTFRCSAFKGKTSTIVETEVDPLDFGTDPSQYLQDENSFIELTRRIAYL